MIANFYRKLFKSKKSHAEQKYLIHTDLNNLGVMDPFKNLMKARDTLLKIV